LNRPSQKQQRFKAVEAGTYEIRISRWPLEIKHPINASLKAGENVPGWSTAYRANNGLAHLCESACMSLDGKIIEEKTVSSTDTEIIFNVELTKGSHKLAPFFKLKKEQKLGAYYASVKKL